MAASYPASTAVFTSKQNIVDIIDASHPNSVQDEIVAIESTVGTNPNLSTTPSPSGTFTATSTSFASVSARIANIETGIVSDTHSQYIRKAADSGNVIIAGASTTRPLTVRGAASQSATLQEWQNSSSTALASVSSSGAITAASFARTGGTSSQILLADGSVTNNFTVNTTAKTSAYTLATSDYNSLIQMNGAFAFTVNTSLSSAPAGTQIHLLALTGGVSVTGTGVTLNGAPGLKLRAAYSSATLICLGTNNWVLIGDLSL
jgi:hypothetical protein